MSRSVVLVPAMLTCLMVRTASAVPPDCYRLEFDIVTNSEPNWTLTFDPDSNDLIWDRDGTKIRMVTGTVGSGIPGRVAVEPNGEIHTYRMIRGVLVFDMDVYEPGCQ